MGRLVRRSQLVLYVVWERLSSWTAMLQTEAHDEEDDQQAISPPYRKASMS